MVADAAIWHVLSIVVPAIRRPRKLLSRAIVFSPMFSERTNWPLAPNRFTRTLDGLRAAKVPLLDLTASNPTQCGFRYDEEAILSAFRNPAALLYDPQPKGTLAARGEVARYYLEGHQVTVDPECIFLTTGTSEAYSYVFRLLCNPGDELLLPKPSYPLFEFLADLQDVRLVPYALAYAHGWFLDFRSVEAAITPRTRAILLVHPNNPTGSFIQPEELSRLNALCRRHSLALIADEVFLDFSWDANRRDTFAANTEALTFTLSGLSKIAALPQMKIAWLIASGPGSLVQPALHRLEVIADTFLSINAPAQAALPALLRQRHGLRAQLLARIRENRATLEFLLRRHPACELLHADAGWYAILRVSSQTSGEDLAINLLQNHHVVVHPGHFYDFPDEGFLVLSLIPPPDVFREGLARVLSHLCGLSA